MNTPSHLLLALVLVSTSMHAIAHETTAPNTPAASAATPSSPVTPATTTNAALPTQYTVVAGDTLAKVAARKDVYGNPKLWSLLYRANNDIIGAQGLIYPGQVLVINRNYTPEDLKAMTERPKPIAKTAPDTKVPVVTASTAAPKPATPALPTTPAPAVAAASLAPAAVPAPAAPPVADAAPTAVAPTAAVARAPAASPRGPDYMNAARRAFAAGDIPWALYYYNTHLASNSHDARAWGELGNVYYLDGQLPESAQAYFNAANLMIDQGRARAATQLMPAIQEGNPGLAQALYGRLLTLRP